MKKNNIVFIAKYPLGISQRDGASIRFLELDNIYKNYSRTYIESFSFPLRTLTYTILREIKHNLLFKSSLNNEMIRSVRYINRKKSYKLFDSTDLIYIESFGNFILLPAEIIKQYGHKMIFDLHGCAIEEAEMAGIEKWKIDNLKYYEKLAFKYIKKFVVVTDNMKNLYIEKYPEAKSSEFIKLPIFPNKSIEFQNKKTDKINLIYSGGNYIWQNSELMIKSIARMIKNNISADINYSFLTPDIEYYTALAKQYNIEKNISIKSVTPSELNDEYAKAHLGLVLRENNIVNRVACPTKLIEYMKAGIVPVVLQPEIGDFNNLGYKYILISDLLEGNIPDFEELKIMQKINYEIVSDMQTLVEESKQKLLTMADKNKNNECIK